MIESSSRAGEGSGNKVVKRHQEANFRFHVRSPYNKAIMLCEPKNKQTIAAQPIIDNIVIYFGSLNMCDQQKATSGAVGNRTNEAAHRSTLK